MIKIIPTHNRLGTKSRSFLLFYLCRSLQRIQVYKDRIDQLLHHIYFRLSYFDTHKLKIFLFIIISPTPPRIARKSGIKSLLLKLPFLLKNDGEK